MPGRQLIGAAYCGHMRDPYNRPVSATYDNSWSLFTRYDWGKDSVLHGWAFGTGVVRVGGRWVTTTGVTNAVFTQAQIDQGVVKLKTGTKWDAFLSYDYSKHLAFKLGCINLLGQIYPFGLQTALISDPSPPRHSRSRATTSSTGPAGF